MADYLSILKKTIDGLPNNTPEIRQAVYRKARAAIEMQLRGVTPPLSDNLIKSQLQSLEEAILVADSEYASPVAAPIVEPSSATPPVQEEPIASAAPAGATPAEPEPQASPIAPTPGKETLQATTEVVAPIVTHATPSPAATETTIAVDTPSLDETTAKPASEVSLAPPPTVGMSDDLIVDGPAGNSSGYVPAGSGEVPKGTDHSSYLDDETSSRGAGRLVLPLIILLALGAGGYALWTNRDSLQPMITSMLSGNTETTAPATDDPVSEDEKILNEDTAAEAEKDDVQLSGGGNQTGGEGQNSVSLEPSEKPIELETTDSGAQNEDEASGEQPVQEVTEGDTTGAQQNDSNQAIPIGEVAYLYEEGSAGAGATRTNAAVAWSLKRESISDGLPPEQIIVATMEVPEKDLSMEMEIKRNVDNSISASHIIEMRFSVPEGFTGVGIDNISRFVMKATEEARGEPLVAVPVKVSEGFFLIALDNLKQAVDVNTQLMLESAWIDIPISYSTGKRALVTLEKGGTGEQVFRDAFQDWRNR